jgi:hypothetical protein
VALNDAERAWFYGHIERIDPDQVVVQVDRDNARLIYNSDLRSDDGLSGGSQPLRRRPSEADVRSA